jgi:predicted NBD/HSP70 family sugar kinase
MDHFAGLDVSVKETSVCIVDDTGRIVKEVKVASEPEALLKVLGNPIYRFKRIGLGSGLKSDLAGGPFRATSRHPTSKNPGTSAGVSFVVRYAIRQPFQPSASVATNQAGHRPP